MFTWNCKHHNFFCQAYEIFSSLIKINLYLHMLYLSLYPLSSLYLSLVCLLCAQFYFSFEFSIEYSVHITKHLAYLLICYSLQYIIFHLSLLPPAHGAIASVFMSKLNVAQQKLKFTNISVIVRVYFYFLLSFCLSFCFCFVLFCFIFFVCSLF